MCLSPEIPSLIELTENKDEKIAKKAKAQLGEKIILRSDLYTNEGATTFLKDEKNDFREYNKASFEANKAMRKYYNSLSGSERKALVDKYY